MVTQVTEETKTAHLQILMVITTMPLAIETCISSVNVDVIWNCEMLSKILSPKIRPSIKVNVVGFMIIMYDEIQLQK